MSAKFASGAKRPAGRGLPRPAGRGRVRAALLYGALAVAGGLVLAESLFLPWYSLQLTVADVEASSSQSAWHAMSVMDALLLLVALVAVMGGIDLARWQTPSPLLLAAGPAGLLLTLIGLIDLPEPKLSAVPGDTASVGREAGPLVALVASAGIAFAGFAARRLTAPGPRPPRGSAGGARGAPPRPPERSPAPRPRARPRTAARRSPSTGRGP
jgi:hypothetical protein